jgi:hypothetical protein
MSIPVLGSVTFNQIFSESQLPADSAGSTSLGMYVVDDDSVVFLYLTNVSGNYGISAVVINTAGRFTYYSTGTVSNNAFYCPFSGPIKNSIFFGVTTLGVSFSFSPQNLGLNNSVPIFIAVNTAINVGTPCDNTPQFYAYDNINNLLGVCTYDASGQYGGPCYSATFSLDDPNNPSLLTSGFVGFYNNQEGFDPYNLTKADIGNIVFSPVLDTNILQSNGISTSLGLVFGPDDSSQNSIIVRNYYECHKGVTTDCSTPNNSFVSSRANAKISFFQEDYNQTFTNQFDSNVKGLVGGVNPFGPVNLPIGPIIQLFDANNTIANIYYSPAIFNVYTAVTNKNIFMQQIDPPFELWQASWPGNFPEFFGNGPQTKQFANLVNLSRPVSPIGAFRT